MNVCGTVSHPRHAGILLRGSTVSAGDVLLEDGGHSSVGLYNSRVQLGPSIGVTLLHE